MLINKQKPAGKYQVNFNATNLSSGVYIYRFRAVSLEGDGKSFEKSSKLMLVK